MSDNERWKEKYSRLLDDYERLEREGSQQIELLQRGLIRSSLAAEGQDPKLDPLLHGLRNLVRQPDSQATLQQQIDAIERHLLSSDQQRVQRQKIQQEALEQLTEQLLACNPPVQVRKALQGLQKLLKEPHALGYRLPVWLQNLSQQQELALQQLKEQQGSSSPGLLGKLLGRNTTPVEASDKSMVMLTSEQPVADQPESLQQQDSIPAVANQHSSMTADYSTVEPAKDSISSEVQQALLKLLQELADSGNTDNLQQVEAQVHSDLSWPELAHILNQVAELIIQTNQQRQQEFSNYLQQLNAKLNEITGSVQHTRSGYESAMQAADRFDEQLHSQVNDIHQDVRDTQNLAELKQRVDQRLNLFVDSLQRYQNERKESEQALLQRLALLNERVQLVENEATQLANQLVEQHEKARQDALTGLANRTAWDERLRIEHERLQRINESLLLAVVDIDHFKRINDSYGHLAGDKVLKILADNLHKGIRKTDFIARFGGEEFVILLPNTPLDSGVELLNKLRKKISGFPFHFKGEPVQITFSAGIGRLQPDEPASQAFARIDEALYRAKQNGRNQTQVAD